MLTDLIAGSPNLTCRDRSCLYGGSCRSREHRVRKSPAQGQSRLSASSLLLIHFCFQTTVCCSLYLVISLLSAWLNLPYLELWLLVTYLGSALFVCLSLLVLLFSLILYCLTNPWDRLLTVFYSYLHLAWHSFFSYCSPNRKLFMIDKRSILLILQSTVIIKSRYNLLVGRTGIPPVPPIWLYQLLTCLNTFLPLGR